MTYHAHATLPVAAVLTLAGITAVAVDRDQDPAPMTLAVAEAPTPVEIATILEEADDETFDAMVQQYCVRCHSERRLRGNLSLESFSLTKAGDHGEVAEKMIRKLRAEMMPPSGSRRPPQDSLNALMVALETRMDQLAAENPDPGYRPFQRLNRAEYQASVRDLLGVDIDVAAFLPPDTKSANFDNIADVQVPSTTLIEGYLRAADYVSRVALGDPEADASSTTYRVSRMASQKDRVEGAPFGTRGGHATMHNFLADGKYVFQIVLHQAPEGELFGRTELDEQVEVSVDGERVAVVDIDRWMSSSDPNGTTVTTDSIDIRAGPRLVAVTFVKRFDAPVHDLITPLDHTLADTQIGLGYGVTTLPHLQAYAIVGPFGASGVSETPTRRQVFTCRPLGPSEAEPCARSIIGDLAKRAYRRPVHDDDMEALLGFYRQGAEEGGFEAGIRVALQAVLASPHFVFRTEEPEGEVRGTTFRISDADLASRLSFFLWGQGPDRELIQLAAEGGLRDEDALRGQVQRMLNDPRAAALSTRFAAQWLRLPDLEKVHPDALDYPYFDATLATAMEEETIALFDHIVEEDRSVLDLLTADYTFVNERLARHYGIPNVTGEEMRKVNYVDDKRRGLLGHGSILTLTSHANRTSPVLRGKWVMEVIMGTPPPPPPPDVPDLEASESIEDGRTLTVREQMAKHAANPSCNSCHRVIDPLGLALENFDVTGAWRVKDSGNPVDPTGEMYDGTSIAGASDLRTALMKRPEVFLRTFTENLMAYALGRRVEYFDMPSVRSITRDAAENEYRISSFVEGVVTSPAFLTSRVEVAADGAGPEGEDR